MTQEAMHAQMGGDVAGSEELIPAGAVTFGLMYRTGVGEKNDEGICIHVYGNDIPGDDKELLRLDCFKYDPHYHYRNATLKQNERLLLDYTAAGPPRPPATSTSGTSTPFFPRSPLGPRARPARATAKPGRGGSEDRPVPAPFHRKCEGLGALRGPQLCPARFEPPQPRAARLSKGKER